MKIYNLIVLLLLVGIHTLAQEMKGYVLDAETGKGIPFVSVSIFSRLDSTVVDYAMTAEDGSFILKNVGNKDNLFFRISSIGYITEQGSLSVMTSFPDTAIRLKPDHKLLDEVVVVGRNKLVSLTPQGLAYAMARDPKSQAEDLLTALRRVPMLTVDGLGKLMVKGGNNYSIYLNGKPFKSANLDPTQVLSSIPAAHVLRVEIITNPDASYEAESGSTVVNIVTQGRNILGKSIMLSLQGETQPKASGLLGYNLVTSRIKLSLSYDYNMNMQRKQPVESFRKVTLPSKSSMLESSAQKFCLFSRCAVPGRYGSA